MELPSLGICNSCREAQEKHVWTCLWTVPPSVPLGRTPPSLSLSLSPDLGEPKLCVKEFFPSFLGPPRDFELRESHHSPPNFHPERTIFISWATTLVSSKQKNRQHDLLASPLPPKGTLSSSSIIFFHPSLRYSPPAIAPIFSPPSHTDSGGLSSLSFSLGTGEKKKTSTPPPSLQSHQLSPKADRQDRRRVEDT